MPILKSVSKVGHNAESLRNVLKYVSRMGKGEELLKTGLGCSTDPEEVFRQFMFNKRNFNM